MDWLYRIDVALFRFGNVTVANPVFDTLFPFLTDIHNWYLLYALAIASLLLFGGKRGIVTVVLLMILIVLSDQLSSSVIKPLVGRARPCSALDAVRLLVPCGGGKSFPSSHAVNNFAMAFLIARLYPATRWYIITFACLVGYSRVYVGVHYPSDIVGGALLGIAIAWAILSLFKAADRFVQARWRSTALFFPIGTPDA